MKTIIQTITLIYCFAFSTSSYSQEKNMSYLTMSSKYVGNGDKRNLEINAILLKPGSYSILLRFTEQDNTNQPSEVLSVVRNSGTILRIPPVDTSIKFSCRYKYSYTVGYEPKDIDSTFIYRLPYSTNKTEPVRVSYLFNLNERYFNKSASKNFSALQFHLEKGDTIFAIRKGQVVRIVDGFEPSDKEYELSFTSNRNKMSVIHDDGTVCYYNIFEQGSFMVSEGDMVYPGTPLGISGQMNKQDNSSRIRIHVCYPIVNPDIDTDSKAAYFLCCYYNPVFATDQGDVKLVTSNRYKAVVSEELIQKEMTKREVRRYGK